MRSLLIDIGKKIFQQGKGELAMKKIIAIYVLAICIIGLNLTQVYASDTIGTIHWKITHVTDMQNSAVNLARPVLALDVDYGKTFFNIYGNFSSEDGLEAAAAHGAGYLYQADKLEIRMDVRSGMKLYRLILDAQTLNGTCAVYDKTGTFEAAGSVDLVAIY